MNWDNAGYAKGRYVAREDEASSADVDDKMHRNKNGKKPKREIVGKLYDSTTSSNSDDNDGLFNSDDNDGLLEINLGNAEHKHVNGKKPLSPNQQGKRAKLSAADDNECGDVTYNVTVEDCTLKFDFTPNQLATIDNENYLNADIVKAFALTAVQKYNNGRTIPFVVLDPCIMKICNKYPGRRGKFISIVNAAKTRGGFDNTTRSKFLFIPFCNGQHFNLWRVQEEEEVGFGFDKLDIYDSMCKTHLDDITQEEHTFLAEVLLIDDEKVYFPSVQRQSDYHSCGIHTLNNLLILISPSTDDVKIDREYLDSHITNV